MQLFCRKFGKLHFQKGWDGILDFNDDFMRFHPFLTTLSHFEIYTYLHQT